MSACVVSRAKSRLREWQTVTVAFACAAFCIKIQRQRLADNIATADDHDVGTLDRYLIANQYLLDAGGRARQIARIPGGQEPQVFRAKAIHILDRINSYYDAAFVDVRRKRKLHQDAMDLRIRVQLPDQFEQVAFAGFGGQLVQPICQASLLAGPALIAHINLARRIVANENCRQARANSVALRRR